MAEKKKKSLLQFRKDIDKKFGWNAVIGMWHAYVHLQYEHDRFDYNHAIEVMGRMAAYQG
jgi:hypothetical protein